MPLTYTRTDYYRYGTTPAAPHSGNPMLCNLRLFTTDICFRRGISFAGGWFVMACVDVYIAFHLLDG